MVLFKLITTNLTEEARKISEEIAVLPKDQWKDVDFEDKRPRAKIALSHIPGEVTIPFRTALNNTIVCYMLNILKILSDIDKRCEMSSA